MKKGVFITGTDTGVGKTLLAAALAHHLRSSGWDIGVMKPVQTGFRPGPPEYPPKGSDTNLLMQACGTDEPVGLITPYRFRLPLAPLAAARREGKRIRAEKILKAFTRLATRHRFVIVEGIGGLAVPLTPRVGVADLARLMGVPLLIVARPGLGTLNHTCLTVAFARSHGLKVLGILLNAPHREKPDRAQKSNPALLEELCGVPVLGRVPFLGKVPRRWEGRSRLLEKVARRMQVERWIKRL